MNELKRELNLTHIMALILGSVIGSGVFINLPIVAREAGSPWMAVLAWFIGGLIWLPQLLILSEISTAYPEEGFGYLYMKKAGSPALGFLYVWTVFWTSDTPSITIVALSAISALSVFWPPLQGTIYTKLFASLLILTLTYIHYRSVKKGGGLQVFLTIVKISPLILLCILGFMYFNSDNLFLKPILPDKANVGFMTLLVAGVAATIWSYAGFTNVLYMTGEMKNPQKVVPFSMILSVGIVTVIYVLISIATSVFVPYETLI
jgi:fructoselysine transporter